MTPNASFVQSSVDHFRLLFFELIETVASSVSIISGAAGASSLLLLSCPEVDVHQMRHCDCFTT
jgi:hypothetical protein